jgi:AhpD family alkylhydroperoxidase
MDMNNPFPAQRFQLSDATSNPLAALFHLERSIELDEGLANLGRVRASQVNGCAFCIDMHWKDARAAGETEEGLYSLDAWRESPLYDARERAALELIEAVTLVAEGHVPDELWDRARGAFDDDDELAQLVFAITAINAWNRLAITARVQPGLYQAGMLEAA